MFPIDRSSIDKSLPVPVGRQLYGLLAYAISHGDVDRIEAALTASPQRVLTVGFNRRFAPLLNDEVVSGRKRSGAAS